MSDQYYSWYFIGLCWLNIFGVKILDSIEENIDNFFIILEPDILLRNMLVQAIWIKILIRLLKRLFNHFQVNLSLIIFVIVQKDSISLIISSALNRLEDSNRSLLFSVWIFNTSLKSILWRNLAPNS